MGASYLQQCYNSPHNYQVGWSFPFQQLDSAALPKATWYYATLLDATNNPDKYLTVTTNW